MRSLARLAPLIVASALLLSPAPVAAALVDWLVLLVDASGSIDSDEYRLQHGAYVTVLRDPDIGLLLEGAQVAIVEFAEVPEVIVDWIDDPEQAAAAYKAHQRSVAWGGRARKTWSGLWYPISHTSAAWPDRPRPSRPASRGRSASHSTCSKASRAAR